MYPLLFRLLLRRLPAERAHALAKTALRLVGTTPLGRAIVRRLVGDTDRYLETQAFGLTFPTPLGVAAGLDKDAGWFEELGGLGFGFVEVGTITALPQAGNAGPRLIRLIRDRALLNRMGFPNPGAALTAQRLARRSARPIVGVNIGKSMAVPVEAAGSDYRAAVRGLAPVCDYLVLNVSSPNTPGLRELQGEEQLRSLVAEVRAELAALECPRPLLLKLSPDLTDEQLAGLAALAVELGVEGIVAVNTTVDRAGLIDEEAASLEDGGISGEPLRARAVQALRCLRRAAGDRLGLVSVGGIANAQDVWERILAGATLVQVYTAFVYEGPAWPRRVNRELARMVKAAGASSVQELVGSEGPKPVTPRSPTEAGPA